MEAIASGLALLHGQLYSRLALSEPGETSAGRRKVELSRARRASFDFQNAKTIPLVEVSGIRDFIL